ncbi:MAG: hypothetical protein D6805_02615 [Planctomycetota bacterium]|nr:MAG: hypothetical protein D6805_02615 [Planctomycetota bacterium]
MGILASSSQHLQNAIVFLAIAIALLYVIRHIRKSCPKNPNSTPPCEHCQQCPIGKIQNSLKNQKNSL